MREKYMELEITVSSMSIKINLYHEIKGKKNTKRCDDESIKSRWEGGTEESNLSREMEWINRGKIPRRIFSNISRVTSSLR